MLCVSPAEIAITPLDIVGLNWAVSAEDPSPNWPYLFHPESECEGEWEGECEGEYEGECESVCECEDEWEDECECEWEEECEWDMHCIRQRSVPELTVFIQPW